MAERCTPIQPGPGPCTIALSRKERGGLAGGSLSYTTAWLRSQAGPASLVIVAAMTAGFGVGRGQLALASLPLVLAVGCLVLLGPIPVLALTLMATPLISPYPLPIVRANAQDVSLAVYAAALAVLLLRVRRLEPRLVWSVCDVAVAGLTCWSLVSLFATGSIPGDLRFFARLSGYPAGLYLAGRLAFTSQARQRWPLVAAAGALGAALLSTWEFFNARLIFPEYYFDVWVDGAFRPGSMLNGPNFLSAYLSLALALLLPLAGWRQPLARLATLMVIPLPAVLAITQSVSGAFAMSAVLAAWLLARSRHRVWLLIGLAIISASVLFARESIAELPLLAAKSNSIDSRYDLIDTAVEAARFYNRDPVWLAVGAGYHRETEIAYEFGVGKIFEFSLPTQREAFHNTFLALLFESGLPASLAFAAVLATGVWCGWRHQTDPVRLAGGLAALSLLVTSGSNTVTSIPQVFGLGLFAIAAAASTPASVGADGTGHPRRSQQAHRLDAMSGERRW